MMPTKHLKINGYTQSVGTSLARLLALLIIIYDVAVKNIDLNSENSIKVTGTSLVRMSLPKVYIPVYEIIANYISTNSDEKDIVYLPSIESYLSLGVVSFSIKFSCTDESIFI